jgi:hypothetical protein
MSAYGAAPFQFGQPFHADWDHRPRVVLETWDEDVADGGGRRVRLALADALYLARLLTHLTDLAAAITRGSTVPTERSRPQEAEAGCR